MHRCTTVQNVRVRPTGYSQVGRTREGEDVECGGRQFTRVRRSSTVFSGFRIGVVIPTLAHVLPLST